VERERDLGERLPRMHAMQREMNLNSCGESDGLPSSSGNAWTGH
jgi:hypothetical protein